VDVKRYQVLLLRAAGSVLQPLGVQEQALSDRLLFSASPLTFLVPRRPGICRTSLSMAHANISGQLIDD
jgi:hypothetical protein